MRWLEWLRTHPFEAHGTAFLLMILPPIGLYWAVQNGAMIWVYLLLVPIILANLIELAIQKG
jgi:hypothetical protein